MIEDKLKIKEAHRLLKGIADQMDTLTSAEEGSQKAFDGLVIMMPEVRAFISKIREPMQHDLKIDSRWWLDVVDRKKTFEVRKHDRDYRKGDSLLLRSGETFDGRWIYDGRTVIKKIEYILEGGEHGLAKGFSVLGLTD